MRRPNAAISASVEFCGAGLSLLIFFDTKEITMTTGPTAPSAEQLAGMFDLNGRVALVAGGDGGIGEAVSWALATLGATLVVSGRPPERATLLTQQLMGAGHRASAFSFDMGKVDDIRRHVDEVTEAHGGVDILVNCIGTQREQR